MHKTLPELFPSDCRRENSPGVSQLPSEKITAPSISLIHLRISSTPRMFLLFPGKTVVLVKGRTEDAEENNYTGSERERGAKLITVLCLVDGFSLRTYRYGSVKNLFPKT